jgi:hypothetical protein
VAPLRQLTLRLSWQSMTLSETKGVENSIRKEAARRQSPSPPLRMGSNLIAMSSGGWSRGLKRQLEELE